VLLWSLAAAEASRAYRTIVVVAPPDRVPAIERIVGARARVVPGGPTRTASSWAAMDALRDHDVVAIHDAARPFASPSLFAQVAVVAAEYGSAVPGLAIAETVRRADAAGRAIEEVDRNGLWTAQTPQAFQRGLLVRARKAAGDRTFTDDAAAVIALNEDVRLVPGERRNFKLTSTEDVAYARELADKGLVAISARPVAP
ncbi:MAG TPA: 2-C-methyl-D-erythritol 4-phosphate cytidylyltransferase, partial [Candidatus Limnocylindria bacterium]|nr:2-C-methyl-D-erythritol 4-phosphate cytidylyltransferase [Candidatus Limnocylindria bacterium]